MSKTRSQNDTARIPRERRDLIAHTEIIVDAPDFSCRRRLKKMHAALDASLFETSAACKRP
jgi:hypothetical protein